LGCGISKIERSVGDTVSEYFCPHKSRFYLRVERGS
jgi:hypothetical protein